MNKFAHGVVLAFFGLGCWFLWFTFKLPLMVLPPPHLAQPGFTRLCVSVGPKVALALVVFATAYCLWIWTREGEVRNSWVAFLAVANAALVFLAVPNVISTLLMLIAALDRLPIK